MSKHSDDIVNHLKAIKSRYVLEWFSVFGVQESNMSWPHVWKQIEYSCLVKTLMGLILTFLWPWVLDSIPKVFA